MTRSSSRLQPEFSAPRARRRAFGFIVLVTLAVAACGPKDAEIKAAAEKALAATPGVTVEVVKGVATIGGQFADSAAMMSGAAAVTAVKGVTSVVDNATVAPPPPPPVVMSPDDSLRTNVQAVLKDHPTLTADVKDGVVTLTGSIGKSDLMHAMQSLNALHPRKVQNKATVKK